MGENINDIKEIMILTVIHGIILVIILVLRVLLDHGGVRVVVPEDVRLGADVLLIHRPRAARREDVLVEDDEVLDQLVDEVLVDDLVPVRGDRHQGRSEADGQIVRIHHVLIAELEKCLDQIYDSKVRRIDLICVPLILSLA